MPDIQSFDEFQLNRQLLNAIPTGSKAPFLEQVFSPYSYIVWKGRLFKKQFRLPGLTCQRQEGNLLSCSHENATLPTCPEPLVGQLPPAGKAFSSPARQRGMPFRNAFRDGGLACGAWRTDGIRFSECTLTR